MLSAHDLIDYGRITNSLVLFSIIKPVNNRETSGSAHAPASYIIGPYPELRLEAQTRRRRRRASTWPVSHVISASRRVRARERRDDPESR